jgi:hypothetical protein
MKKIIVLIAFLLFVNNCFSQTPNPSKTIKIYDPDSASVWKFYKTDKPQAGYKNLYIQLKGTFEGYTLDYRYGNIYRLDYQTNLFSSNYHHGILQNQIQFGMYGWEVGYNLFFTVSKLDTNLILLSSSAMSWEAYSFGRYTKNNGDTTIQIYYSMGVNVGGMAIDGTNDSLMYVNSPGGIIKKTTNRGLNWFNTDTLTSYSDGYMSVSPFNHNTVFISNGYILYRSTTGGYDFQQILNDTIYNSKFIFDSSDNSIYLVCSSVRGILKSTNNGNNWTQTFNKPCNDLEIDPVNNNIFYAGTGEGIYKSTNKGSSWFLYNNTFSPSKNILGIIKNPNSGDTLYAATPKGVYKVYGQALLDTSSARYFPLAVGNVYTYYYTDFYTSSYSKGRITKDSVIFGHKYYQCFGIPGISSGNWIRYDSLSGLLLALSPGNGCGINVNDKIIDSLSSRLNDTSNYCLYYAIIYRKCNDTGSVTLFGNYTTKKKGFAHDGLIVADVSYALNIGISAFGSGEPPPISGWSSLTGCKVNGIVYGDTNAYYTVSGNIYYTDNNQPATGGYVKAIKLNRVTGAIITLDSVQILANGSYTLTKVPQDSVDIGVYPNSTTQNDWIVTYYPSTIYWKSASVIYPTGNLTNVNIGVKRLLSANNPNSINGQILKLDFSSFSNIKDAVIYAMSGETFVRCAISDITGTYHLLSLPVGNLKIVVDRLGYNGDSTNVYMTASSIHDTINFYLSRFMSSVNRVENTIPTEYKLYQNYPNPFNPVTNIKYQITNNRFVTLRLYDILGKEVAVLVNEKQAPGEYEVNFDAGSLPSGVYFYKLTAGDFSEIKKMILIK